MSSEVMFAITVGPKRREEIVGQQELARLLRGGAKIHAIALAEREIAPPADAAIVDVEATALSLNEAILSALIEQKPGSKRTQDLAERYDRSGKHCYAAEIPVPNGGWMTISTIMLARAALAQSKE